jgi:hypothetical protein
MVSNRIAMDNQMVSMRRLSWLFRSNEFLSVAIIDAAMYALLQGLASYGDPS